MEYRYPPPSTHTHTYTHAFVPTQTGVVDVVLLVCTKLIRYNFRVHYSTCCSLSLYTDYQAIVIKDEISVLQMIEKNINRSQCCLQW